MCTYDELDKRHYDAVKKCEKELSWIGVLKLATVVVILLLFSAFAILNKDSIATDSTALCIGLCVSVVIIGTAGVSSVFLPLLDVMYSNKLNTKIDSVLGNSAELRLFDLVCDCVERPFNHITMNKDIIEISINTDEKDVKNLVYSLISEMNKYNLVGDRGVHVIVNEIYLDDYGNYQTSRKYKLTLLHKDYIKINWDNVKATGLYALMLKEYIDTGAN